TVNNLSVVYSQQGKFDQAAATAKACYDVTRRTLGPDNQNTWVGYNNLGQMYLLTGAYDEARRILVACVDASASANPTAEQQLFYKLTLGKFYLCTLDIAQAQSYLQMAHDGFKRLTSATHHHTRSALYCLCLCFLETMEDDDDAMLARIDALEDELKQAECHHDTWTGFPCHGCCRPTAGTYFTCPKCPPLARRFCCACVALAKHTLFCDHDAPLKGFKPPARALQETRLALLAKVSALKRAEYDRHVDAYVAYCVTYDVAEDERTIAATRTRLVACIRPIQLALAVMLAALVLTSVKRAVT
ncbi:hypothetical protein As57867_017531, partial [Aphanomyces stellatus]